MTFAQVISVSKDIVLAVAAITGSVVAVMGLDTWKRQLRGHSEYELSRRILVSLYKYRDAINGVRHPAMLSYEMPEPPDEIIDSMNREQIRFFGISHAYQKRWDKVQDVKATLYETIAHF